MEASERVADDDAVAKVARLGTLFTPWALRAAVTLRIPDLIASGVTDVGGLAFRAGVDPAALRRLIRYLVLLEVLRASSVDRVELGELGAVLCHGHPAGLAGAYDQNVPFARRGDEAIPGLVAAVRTGKSVWADISGRSFWDDLAADQELGRSFAGAMAAHAAALGPALAERYDWSGVTHVADVGGGTGHVLAAVLATHPDLAGTLVDLPDTVAQAGEVLRDVAGRVTVHGGSFFDPLPVRADVCVLANVLHDWSDADATAILRRCAATLSDRGRVLVVERVLDDVPSAPADPGQFVAGQRDLAMLLLLDAGERTEAGFRAIGTAAGLRLTAVVPLLPGQGLSTVEFEVC